MSKTKMDISEKNKSENVKKETSGKKQFKQNIIISAGSILVILAVLFTIIFYSNQGSNVQARDLMKGISPSKVDAVKLSNDFIKSQADFSVELFKKTILNGENTLISPASVYLALAMTANGADGNTLKEFEKLLGKYGLSMSDINKFSFSYAAALKDVESGRLNIADSIWYDSERAFKINQPFLKTNADYFGSAAYNSDFNSPQTLNDINNWVKSNTGNLIKKLMYKINPDSVMYLINTIYFENEWLKKYGEQSIGSDYFTTADGKSIKTDFMYSTEFGYLEDDNAKGFVKPYKDEKFSFVALLPDKGVSVEDYAATLTGEKLLSILKNKEFVSVKAGLPKFKSEYSKSLIQPLKAMGLKDCFDETAANLTKMGSVDKDKLGTNLEVKLYVSEVLHKTFIQVDGLGTKAGAVTSVRVSPTASPIRPKEIILDRPFVYAIVDNDTNLPVFIGTMNNPG
ncbi:MAG: serpin family protein [Clostridia bacterium]|jgi:serpin B